MRFLLLLLFLSSCAQNQEMKVCKNDGIYIEHETLCIVGLIDYRSAQEIDAVFQNSFSRIAINSKGGDAEVAIQAARQIRESGIFPQFFEYCLSACAQYMLPASSTVHIVEGTKVGFHHSLYSIHHIYSTLDGVPEQKLLQRRAEIEAEYYDELSLTRDLLLYPLSNIPIERLTYDRHRNSNGMAIINWADYNFVTFPRDVIENMYNLEITGRWDSFGHTEYDSRGNIVLKIYRSNTYAKKSFTVAKICQAFFAGDDKYSPNIEDGEQYYCINNKKILLKHSN